MTVRNTFATEIEANVLQLKEEGWCVIEGVIPENEVGAVREEAETSQVEYQRFSEETEYGQGTSLPLCRRSLPIWLTAECWA